MTTLPFSKVGIDGFRGLRHLELDGLGRINILVGGNNSGKTSVLEALSILCQPYNPDEWLAMIRRRDFGGLDETRVQSLRWCFTEITGLEQDELASSWCELKCEGSFPLRKLVVTYTEFTGEPSPDEMRRAIGSQRADNLIFPETIRGAELVHIPDWLQTTGSTFHGQTTFLDSIEQPTLRLWERITPTRIGKSKSRPKLDVATLTPYSYQMGPLQAQFQSKLIFQKDSSTLELLRDFDADIEGIDLASFRGHRPTIYIKHRRLGIAPLSIFGDAMRRSVLLAGTLLALQNGGVLLIDEVEAGIHVGALGRVFEWLVKAARTLNVQVFVTTHSLEALDALIAADKGDDIVTFHLRQTEERTVGKRLDENLVRQLREQGYDPR
ncbi:AAA family ATPase [Methylomagnum ishizawai]|uniref:AAA family ATPase n=1 Tax=Methylomagnum ishizawai TaxID=1760988 RepID=UPI001C7F003D|nr:AAA family ATPase [Methylomagnum ishizawai]